MYIHTTIVHVEYEERGEEYGIIFIFNLFCEYINLEYVRVPVIYRVNQAEYGIYILVVASQEYTNTYSTCRLTVFAEVFHEFPQNRWSH